MTVGDVRVEVLIVVDECADICKAVESERCLRVVLHIGYVVNDGVHGAVNIVTWEVRYQLGTRGEILRVLLTGRC